MTECLATGQPDQEIEEKGPRSVALGYSSRRRSRSLRPRHERTHRDDDSCQPELVVVDLLTRAAPPFPSLERTKAAREGLPFFF